MSNNFNSTKETAYCNKMKNFLPNAYTVIKGNADNPTLKGTAKFYGTANGTLVETEVFNLPFNSTNMCSSFYGMHIHENGDCTLPFDKTGNHYNHDKQPHPLHAGDMPPLLGNCGYAYMVFYTERFKVKDILNRSIIIHSMADDFTTQPSGNSGEKIGCGVILKF